MKPLSAGEARLLERLERGLGLRLLVGPIIGAMGGFVFATVMLALVGPSGRFTLGEQSQAYAALETAVGPLAAFVLLCVVAFAGLGVLLAVLIAVRLSRMRAQLRWRRDAAGVAPARPVPA